LTPFTTGLEIFAINLMIRADIIRSRQTRSRVWRILIVSGFLLLFYSNVRADTEQGKRLYRENCAPCHGESGKGDGVGSQSLPVRPADHTNGAAMKSRTDAFLRDVIAKGGSAMRLSSFMPAWKGILKDSEIQDLVAYIRSLALPPK
jgi:mono/diheme cytochrome c family protein